MKKTRAAAAAIIGLALTATGVLAAAPHTQVPTNAAPVSAVAQDDTVVGGSNYNHGGAVSALVEATETPEAPDTETPDAPKTDTTDPAGAQGAHGAAVSLVAQDKTKVSGPNNNHGGAVSLVARGTHGPAATTATQPASTTHGKSTGKGKAGAHTASH